jgi:hypothetical protein
VAVIRTTRIKGSAKSVAESPEITAIATAFVPKNNPVTYNMPRQGPKAEPTPAVDKTPGPGVNSNKITAVAKVNIVQSSLIQERVLDSKATL